MIKYIITNIKGLALTDLIDIGIIALFIYLILLWFKRARARFMFFGMVILGAIYVLARFFGLYLTTMAFQAFFAIALIVIVVIFQDDIRQFFERIGLWGVPRRRSLATTAAYQDIDILTSALAELSRKKIGALVVVQGKDPLERHLEAGVDLDSLVSKVLLESIFDPHVPSHDGAVVVSRGRAIKLGCYLPISTNIKEIGRLGTRHAAALGLAERTDALCLVVSEEQGTISVAEGARMRQLKDAVELSRVMENFYQRNFPKREKNILMSFLAEHFNEKIIALILTAGLWLIFGHHAEVIRRDFTVPIEYRNLSQDIIIKETKVKEITATLSGPAQTFNLVNLKDLKVALDMAKIKEGDNHLVISRELIRTPVGIAVVDFQPREIVFTAYRMVQSSAPIELNIQGRLPQGLTLKQVTVVPKEVGIIAPSLIPKSKLKVTTEPIDFKGITQTVTLSPKLILPADVGFADNRYPEIKVTIEVEGNKK